MPQADLAETLIAKSISEDDILRCHELSTEAGWNHTIKDWGFLATMVWSKGYRRRDRIVGTAVNVDLDHELSWIAMVLVDKAYRRQGIGIRMLSDSVDAIERSGKSAGLDASAHGLPLYQKLGFKEHYKLTRFRGSAPAPVERRSRRRGA